MSVVMVFLLLAEKFSLGKLLSNGTAIMSSRNLLPIYCIPYSRCRYDFLCEYRYALSSYLSYDSNHHHAHSAHRNILHITHRVLDSYHYNAGLTFFVVFLMSLCIVTIRGAHFEKNFIRFGWVMDISNNFS